MSRDKFRVVLTGIITYNGKILLGKKEQKKGHPISNQWHLPGGHIDYGEKTNEAIKRELKEETGLNVDVHQLLDAIQIQYQDDRTPVFRIFYHCEASSSNADAGDDLTEVKWISPENLYDELGEYETEKIGENSNINRFVEKLEKMPVI